MTAGRIFKSRLLVVDDERSGRTALRYRLGEGYAVDRAGSSNEAFERIAEAPPDAVMVNLEIPNSDGLELIRRLRERDDTLPILALASPNGPHSAADAIRAGAEEYVANPDDSAALVLLLERAIE